MESDAALSSHKDYFYINEAKTQGGGIFATTRTILEISESKFIRNSAVTDSAISAYMTSEF